MLTICILTKDNQDDLSRLLTSLAFADQIIIVDDYSVDNTESIARAHKCDFYKRKLGNDFAAQRNYALKKAKNEWVLFIDPDEQVSSELASEIQQALVSPTYDGYAIKREDVFFGKKLRYGETGSMWLIRLGRKKSPAWQRPVHEVWPITHAGRLKNVLYHHPHQSVAGFIKKINYYTSIEAQFRQSQKQKTNVFELIAFPTGKFLKNYLLKLGFLDGMEGFSMAVMMSIHSFLVRAKQLTSQ